ncbi:MAG: large subunit ribosomal protein L31e [Patescibacteria group bacterium]|jgi:large subunit ribosomal protein L31e
MAEETKTPAKEAIVTPEVKEDVKTQAPVKKAEKEEKTQKVEEKKVEDKPKKTESKPAVKKTPKKDNKTEEKKVLLERTYVVPMRRGFLKVPEYKRSKKAVKTLKEFIAKHMKVEERDTRKVKVDIYLNNEIWFKGVRKPVTKIKVIATKQEDGTVIVKLADVPEIVQFKMNKDAKRRTKVDKKELDKVITQEAAEEKTKEARANKEDKEEAKEMAKTTGAAGEKANTAAAKAAKHNTKNPNPKVDNMSTTAKRKVMQK